MSDCVFCKIIQGDAPASIVHKDECVTAFRDIHPVAPTHILLVPNKHIASVNDITPDDEPVLGYLFTIARKIASQEGINSSGYRLIVNTGVHGGQVIPHLHMHLLGGRKMHHSIG